MDAVTFGHLLMPPVSSISCHFCFIIGFYGSEFLYCSSLDYLQFPLSKNCFPAIRPVVLLPPLFLDAF